MYDGARGRRTPRTRRRARSSAELDTLHGRRRRGVQGAGRLASRRRAGGAAGGRGGRGGGAADGAAVPPPPPTLESVSAAMLAAAMAMQSADVAPTASRGRRVRRARASPPAVMAHWTKLTTVGLAALNAKRKAAGQPAIVVPK